MAARDLFLFFYWSAHSCLRVDIITQVVLFEFGATGEVTKLELSNGGGRGNPLVTAWGRFLRLCRWHVCYL